MPKFEFEPQVETPGIVADAITKYLESHDKRMDEAVLAEAMTRIRRTLMRQLMRPREDRKGVESNTLYSGPCARKSAQIYRGVEREPLKARTVLKFVLGDMVELAVIAIAKLAGVDIGLNNEDLTVQGEDCKLIPVHPDGLLHENGRHYNLEIKSCDSRTFDTWVAQGGPPDDWGYRTQATVEIQAWRENMVEVNETIFLAVSTGSRQGSIAEWRLPFEPSFLSAWHARRSLVRNSADLPPIPFSTEPEFEFVKGKAISAETIAAYGEPVERKDKNGKTYGWDVPTGRERLPLHCSYCDYKKQCWPAAEMDLQGGKPVWLIPAKKSVMLNDREWAEHLGSSKERPA